MSEALLIAAAALTSLAAILAFARGRVDGLATALGLVLETVGATVLFFAANLTVAATIVLLARRIIFYWSLYEAADVALLFLSFLEATTFTLWSRVRSR